MLKKNYEYRAVLSKGKYYSGDYIKAIIVLNNKKCNYLGLAVSTKYGKAIQRNKVKRYLRESYKDLEKSWKKGYSIVFLVKKDVDIRQLNYNYIKKDMLNIFNKAEVMVMD